MFQGGRRRVDGFLRSGKLEDEGLPEPGPVDWRPRVQKEGQTEQRERMWTTFRRMRVPRGGRRLVRLCGSIMQGRGRLAE